MLTTGYGYVHQLGNNRREVFIQRGYHSVYSASRISEKRYSRRNISDWSLVLPKDITPPNFKEKTFANSPKTLKFAKFFSVESFPLYGTTICKWLPLVLYYVTQTGESGSEATVVLVDCTLHLSLVSILWGLTVEGEDNRDTPSLNLGIPEGTQIL